jgi:radical SAM superfamily enzyme YgiQ (UPF0313 family)
MGGCMKFIVPPNFYVINEDANPPMQLEPFYNYVDADIVHLKRGQRLEDIPEDDFYGITAYNEDYKMAELVAKFLKRRDPKCTIAIGGCHATYKPQEISEVFDHVIVGNGEWFIKSLFADPPLPLQGGDTSPTENTEWDEKSFRHFIKYNPNYHRHAESSYTIRTSYGCLWRCLFCANRKWNGIKFRSVSDIERQLNYLSSNGVRNLRVIDEVFTAHPEFEALCELFSSFEWNAQDRLDMLTGQKCAVLKKNGCKRVQVGIESFDEEIRRQLNKRLSDVEIANGIRNAVEVGLQLDAFIMLGLPYDTEYTIRRTVDKALEFFGREHVRPDIFVPYVGTAIGDAPEKHNLRMLTTDSLYFSTFAFQNMYGRIVAVPKHEADVREWEKLLFETLYELSPDIVRKTLDQPIKDWYTDYEMYSL